MPMLNRPGTATTGVSVKFKTWFVDPVQLARDIELEPSTHSGCASLVAEMMLLVKECKGGGGGVGGRFCCFLPPPKINCGIFFKSSRKPSEKKNEEGYGKSLISFESGQN